MTAHEALGRAANALASVLRDRDAKPAQRDVEARRGTGGQGWHGGPAISMHVRGTLEGPRDGRCLSAKTLNERGGGLR